MTSEEMTLGSWLDALASEAPAPGGGAAAAMTGALAAALISMVARFTLGRPKYAEVEEQVQRILESSEKARAMLMRLIEADAQAFTLVATAYRLPKSTEEEKTIRNEHIQMTLASASEVSVATAEVVREVINMGNLIAPIGNKSVLPDVGTAIMLGMSAINAVALNVRDNLRGLHDEVGSHALQKRLIATMDDLTEVVGATLDVVQSRTQS